jgi:predicted ester cyclase
MSEQENIKAAQSFIEAWNSGDLNKNAQYEAENYLGEAPGSPGPLNAVQNRAYNQNFLTAFPGSKFEVVLTVTQGDYVVTNWKVSGVHTGPLQTPSGGTIPPTGKRASLTGSSTAQVKNGKVVHSWNFWDLASLLGQLGLLPPM